MSRPALSTVAELLKPITWFPPMWAFGCGVVASGAPVSERWGLVLVGVLLAGPLVCATSQAVNDWFDRHVDAINEPNRPIPSGRMPGRWGLYIAVLWTLLSLAVGLVLGPVGWNLAAGMSGGELFVLDDVAQVKLALNGDMAEIAPATSASDERLHALIQAHATATASPLARRLLSNWAQAAERFVRIVPSTVATAEAAEREGAQSLAEPA